MIRQLEQQFEPGVVNQIKELISRLNAATLPEGASRYYAIELTRTLEAGCLLASLQVSASLLELVIRSIIVERCNSALAANKIKNRDKNQNLEKTLEEMRELGFSSQLEKLVEFELFDSNDAEKAKEFYKFVRIPVHHGLTRRFVEKNQTYYMNNVMNLLRGPMPVSSRELEEVVEDNALAHIEAAIGIIERNST